MPRGPFEVVGYDAAGTGWIAEGSPFDVLPEAQGVADALREKHGRSRSYLVHDLDNPEAGDLSDYIPEEQ